MPQKHTTPAWQQELETHWQAMIDSGDPHQAEIGRRMRSRAKQTRQRPMVPRATEQSAPAWAHVLLKVTGAQHATWNPSQFKGGHDYAHSSKSGTCVSVDLVKGFWYCSSCRRGGTAVTWVMQSEECDYLVAARLLLERYGEPDAC